MPYCLYNQIMYASMSLFGYGYALYAVITLSNQSLSLIIFIYHQCLITPATMKQFVII